jgi:SAM-dependent methyltransferase
LSERRQQATSSARCIVNQRSNITNQQPIDNQRSNKSTMDHLLELTGRAEATHFWFRGFRKFVSPLILRLAAGRTDLRMVDCGCGTGSNLRLLKPHGRVLGFDLTRGGVLSARHAGWPVVQADITRIPLADRSVDIATSFDVMQCIDADEAAVHEMARILRPGGAVVLTVAALEMLRGDHSEAWKEVRRYTPAHARRLVETAGLRVEHVVFLFASTFPLMLAVRVSQRLMRPFRSPRTDTDIAVPPAPVNALLTAVVSAEASVAQFVRMPIGSSLLVVGRKPG